MDRPKCDKEDCNNKAKKNYKIPGTFYSFCDRHSRNPELWEIRKQVRLEWLQKNGTRTYIVHKKNSCEECGFTPELKCLLQIDHIDSDRTNNDLANLQTLCVMCHALKTHRDHHKGSCENC